MDLAGLCSYEGHQKLVDLFMTELLRPALDRHLSTSMEQVMRADRHVFVRIAELTMTGIRVDLLGRRPLEIALDKILLEPKLSYLLMQTLAGGSSTRTIQPTDDGDKAERKRKHDARMAEQQSAKKARLAANPKAAAKALPKAPAKGAGKGARPPAVLAGKASITPDGKNLCFGFNLGTCSLCADGDKCSKGWHLCMEPGCFKAHSLKNH